MISRVLLGHPTPETIARDTSGLAVDKDELPSQDRIRHHSATSPKNIAKFCLPRN
jgi:hypothetical protein